MEVVVAGGGRGGVVALAGRPAGLTGYTMAVAAFYSPSMELERRKIFSAVGLESGVSRTTGRRIGIARMKLFWLSWPNEVARKRGSLTYRNNSLLQCYMWSK